MLSVWNGITEGQGAVLAALLTVVAAIVGVALGSRLFGGKVTDLRAALSEAQAALNEHETSVDEKLSAILEKVKLTEENILSTLDKINRFSATLNSDDLSDISPLKPEEKISPIESIKEDWSAIRESLEDIVSDPEIDGRTRAKFARIDRRQYGYLIESYHDDFGLQNVTKYRRALQLWQKYRSGRTPPTESDVKEMRQLRTDLVGASPA